MNDMWSKYLLSRSVEDRNRIIEHYVPWADKVARRIARKLPTHATLDAKSDAFLGLIQAVERYDPQAGLSFESFAKKRMAGAILDGLRGFSRFDARTSVERKPSTFTSLGLDAGAVFGSEDDLVVDNVDEARVLLSKLKFKQRIILVERCNGTSMAEIGAILGRDESTVCQIEHAALRKLRRIVGSSQVGGIAARKQSVTTPASVRRTSVGVV